MNDQGSHVGLEAMIGNYRHIGPLWHICMSLACCAADPGSNPGEGNLGIAKQIDRFHFVFHLRFGWYGSVGWQSIAVLIYPPLLN